MTSPPAHERTSTEAQSPYRDRQLAGYLKELRACCKPFPRAKAALERTETRLKYILRVIETWDRTHGERAETLIRLGNVEAAQTFAALVFDDAIRLDLLGRAQIGSDTDAGERVQAALELGRTIE